MPKKFRLIRIAGKFALSFAMLALAIAIGDAVGSVASAEVQYPWCAQYRRNNGTNCGFVTYQQCLATISGVGGFCYQNPAYQPSARKQRRN